MWTPRIISDYVDVGFHVLRSELEDDVEGLTPSASELTLPAAAALEGEAGAPYRELLDALLATATYDIAAAPLRRPRAGAAGPRVLLLITPSRRFDAPTRRRRRNLPCAATCAL